MDWHFKDCLQIPKIVVGVYKANEGGQRWAHTCRNAVKVQASIIWESVTGGGGGLYGSESSWLRAGGEMGFPSGGAPPEPRDKLETRTPLNR